MPDFADSTAVSPAPDASPTPARAGRIDSALMAFVLACAIVVAITTVCIHALRDAWRPASARFVPAGAPDDAVAVPDGSPTPPDAPAAAPRPAESVPVESPR